MSKLYFSGLMIVCIIALILPSACATTPQVKPKPNYEREKITEIQKGGKVYVEIKKSFWSEYQDDRGHCHVILHIELVSNARVVSVDTYGTGVYGCTDLMKKKNGNFAGSVTVLSRAGLFPGENVSTYLRAYESDVMPKNAEGSMSGSGDTAVFRLESGTLR